ncbi:MAG: cyclase family protein [Burkholderiaceae bacterium]
MCDCNRKFTGWKGWLNLPEAETPRPVGPWVDVSHVITEDLSRSPVLPRPRITQIMRLPENVANVTELQMVCHHGTHVDAPRHFLNDGPSFEDIPIDRLSGQGVVWKLDKAPLALIEPEDFENATPALQPGDIVLINTGWWHKINTKEYDDHPCLSDAAAQWLVDRQAKLIAVDFTTPDLTAHLRPKNFAYPVHHILLSHGVLVAEHMTNLDSLSGKRVEVVFGALNILDSDGGPARVLAREIAA